MSDQQKHSGAASGGVRILLRLEGLVWFLLGTSLFAAAGGQWWFYAVLLLAPDLSFLGYLAGPRLGAIAYNLLHSTIGPVVLAGIGFFADDPLMIQIALIWIAHIGADRALGFGLKYSSGFGDTHLGRIGRHSAAK